MKASDPKAIDAALYAGANERFRERQARYGERGNNGFRRFGRNPVRLVRDPVTLKLVGRDKDGRWRPVEFTPSGLSWRWCEFAQASDDVWDYHVGRHVFCGAVGPAPAGLLGSATCDEFARRRGGL